MDAGELVAIVGPSGSGKSTLLHVIGTLERPSSGVVADHRPDVADASDRELSRLRARSIGFVFQQFFLAEHPTALENVADGLLYAGVGRARAARARGAGARAGRARATARSSARRSSRAASASASRSRARWSARPAIVLADEPTGNLDSAARRRDLRAAARAARAGRDDRRDHARPRARRAPAAPGRDARRRDRHRHRGGDC